MSRTKDRINGFSLVELLAVVMIIGILASIAIPQYDSYIARGRISEGISVLSELQLRQEQAYQDNRAYVTGMQPRQAAQYWTANCVTANTNQTFICTATPTASSGVGYVLKVDQAGAKSTEATAPTPTAGWVVPSPATCWVKTKNGSC